MNLYEHTIIAKQDASPAELKQLTEKYSKIVEKNDGEIVKTENWGLLNLSYLIKKNRKGSYIHFKIKGNGNVIEELEKNEAIENHNGVLIQCGPNGGVGSGLRSGDYALQ